MFPQENTLYWIVGMEHSITIADEVWNTGGSEIFSRSPTSAPDWISFDVTGTFTWTPTDANTRHFEQWYTTSSVSGTPLQLVENKVDVVVKQCSDITNCIDCTINQSTGDLSWTECEWNYKSKTTEDGNDTLIADGAFGGYS